VLHREQIPSGPMPRPGRPPARQGSRARSVALTVLAIVAAMLVGILVATLVSNSRDNGQGNGAESSQQAPPAAEDKPTPEEYEQAIRDYYALLPEQTDEAFALLTGRAKEKSNGERTYTRFWNTIDSVEVLNTDVKGNRVSADLLYTTKGGRTSREATSFALVQQDGKLLIENFVRVGNGG
jgi:eukaryotic-like serine/threonine-protein kinase